MFEFYVNNLLQNSEKNIYIIFSLQIVVSKLELRDDMLFHFAKEFEHCLKEHKLQTNFILILGYKD